MPKVSRKDFISTSAMAVAALFVHPAIASSGSSLKLSFSTLGCPEWDLNRIMDFAVQYGYKGIEVRGIQRELDLPKCKEFNSASARKETLKRMKSKGLQFINLGSSANLHIAEPVKRLQQIDEAKKFIDLANDLNCPYVRVFPNNFPKEQSKEVTIDLITKGMNELGDYATGSGVKVLMETHGDVVYKNDLIKIMQSVNPKNTGLIWDVSNMWTVTKEDPSEVYAAINPYIHHVHVKDAKLVDGKLEYVFLGKGDVPIMKAIDLLVQNNYKGYYSFEWEKLWHPEIAEPSEAFADYANTMNTHLGKK
ncbi:MAG: sugar phosphate isomerase/epimerase family protein [Flavitalea sp.]